MIKRRKPRIVVAMSGGVDSSVAAAMLVKEGYEVIGIMLRLWSESENVANRCCTIDSIRDAESVAEALNIPFYVRDYRQIFHQLVVEHFILSFSIGITPNPCAICNHDIRFGLLLQEALSLGANYLATGHYARIRHEPGNGYQLLKAGDDQKDQSYILYSLGQKELAHILFPIGEFNKVKVRALAQEFGLPVYARPDSQDLCFLADNDYRKFLQRHSPTSIRPGPITRRDGSILGEHSGLSFFTIGQRRGLGISFTEPLYVIDLDVNKNAVIVGTIGELGNDELSAGDAHYVMGQPPPGSLEVSAKIRYKSAEYPGQLFALPGRRIHLKFNEPLRDITPGQVVVFYKDEILIGGGIIEKT